MSEFQFVDLNDCFVLSWHLDGGDLAFEILASLWPGHPRYSEPPAGDYTCYRRSTIIFPNVLHVDGLGPMSDVWPSKNPDGSIDYGEIADLRLKRDGSYALSGEFGEVTIKSGKLRFVIG